MSDNIQVAIRVRQLIEKECQSGYKSNWTINGQSISCNEEASNGRKPVIYTFDYIYDETTVTLDLFEQTCKPIVDASLNGFNGTIFAYGQSSSGKTHTMTGSAFQPGIIPLAVDEIFDQIENIPDREYLLRVSYMEIYNEKLTDLLKDDDTSLKLQEDTDKTVRIVGIHEEMVDNRSVVTNVMKKGNAKRHTAATKQNDRSSRSHCILRFVIESRVRDEEEEAVKVSNLYFVDLAGSEKAAENIGDRFREGCSINKSLFTLGNVIRKLSGDDHFQHTSYRDSKLTRVLQNALGGNSKTAIICTMTPAHVEESESTLKFASRAKTIKNAAHVNEVMSDAALLKKYQRMVKSLEKKVKEGTDGHLVKQIQEREAFLNEQAETIKSLKKMILISGKVSSDEPVAKKRRRETWAPGKSHAKPGLLSGATDFLPLQPFDMNEPIIEEEEEPQEMMELEKRESNDVFNEANTVFNEAPTDINNFTIEMNPTVVELFELQDKHAAVLEELEKKDTEMKEIKEFKEMERKMQEESINELTEKLKEFMQSQQWTEDELFKAQQERNSLRQKVESMARQVTSAEQGTGLTGKCEELAEAQRKIDELNAEIDVQKSRYEFHIEQMKKKLESLTGLLEQQGVDSEVIKQRLYSEKEQGSEIAELKTAHEGKVNDLQNEIDMLVLSLEREQAKIKEMDELHAEEMEEQKKIFVKDIQERDEEIQIYIDLFEKESVPLEERKSIQAEVISLRDQLEKQHDEYEQKLQLLQTELDRFEKRDESVSADCQKPVESQEALNNQQQIDSLRSEMEQLENLNRQEVLEWENKYDCLMEEYHEKIKELQDKTTSPNEFMEAELENLKSLYEEEVNILKKKNESLIARMRRQSNGMDKSMGESMANSMNAEMIEKYEVEIEKLNLQLEEERKKYATIEPEVKDSDKQIVETLKEQMEEMKSEYESKLLIQKEMFEKMANSVNIEAYEKYEVEIENLNHQLEEERNKLATNEPEVKESYQHTVDTLREQMEEMKTEYENKLLGQKEIFEKMVNSESMSNSVNTEAIEKYEVEIEKLNLQLVEERKKVVAVESEVKESYQQMVETLTEQMNEMKTEYENKLLNQKEMIENMANSENTESIEKYEVEIEKLNLQLDEERKKLADIEQEVKDSNQQMVETLKKQMEEMKIEYENKLLHQKEKFEKIVNSEQSIRLDEFKDHVDSKVELDFDKHIQDLKDMYETKLKEAQKEAISTENESLNLENEVKIKEIKEYYEGQLQLMRDQKDMTLDTSSSIETIKIKAEMEEMKQSYEEKILELTINKSSTERNVEHSDNINDLQREILKADMDEMKKTYEMQIEELQTKYDMMAAKMMNVDDIKQEMTAEVESVVDLKSEMMAAEMDHTVDLKQEMMAVEENNVIDLKSEMMAAVTNHTTDLRQEMMAAERENMGDLQHELLVTEMKAETDLKQELMAVESETIAHHEYEKIVEEMENMRASHQREVNELNEKLKQITSKVNLVDTQCHYESQEVQTDTPVSDLPSALNRSTVDDQDTCMSCCKEREVFDEKCRMYESTIKEIGEELASFKQSIKKLSEDIELLQAANKALKSDKLELINKNADLQEKLEVCTEVVEELKMSLKESEEDNESLRLSVTDSTEMRGKIAGMEQEKELYNDLVSGYEDQIKELSEKLDMERKNAEQIIQYESLISELREKLSSEVKNRELLEEYEIRLKDLTQKLNSENESSKMIDEYKMQIKDLSEKLSWEIKKNECIIEYESQIKELQWKLQSQEQNDELISEYEMQVKNLTERLNSESSNSELVSEYELQIEELTEKLRYEQSQSEQIPDLENQIKELSDKLDAESTNSELINEYELQIKELKERLSVESANCDLIYEYESQIEELKSTLNSLREELDSMISPEEVKLMEEDFTEKMDSIRKEKEDLQSALETIKEEKEAELRISEDLRDSKLESMDNLEATMCALKKENSELVQKVQELEARISEKQQLIGDLEEDKWMLERNLHPDTIKYHSQPENIDWENKWDLFVREERRKRREVRSECLRLRAENEKLKAGAQATLDDAIQISKLTDELITLREKVVKLEEQLKKKTVSAGYIEDPDHSCKFRQENVKMLTEMDQLKEDLESGKQSLEYVTQCYEQRISKLKNEIRRLGDQDKTFDVSKIKQPSFTEEKPTPKPDSGTNVGYGSSTSGGIVDFYKVCLVEAENKDLKRDLEKAMKKISMLESKENVLSKDSLVKQADSSTLNASVNTKERHALEDVNVKAVPPKSSDKLVEITKKKDQPDSSKQEDYKFDLSFLQEKPEERVRVVKKKNALDEDPNQCKTS